MVCRVVRRSYAATAALVLALTVVACGDDSSDPSDASSTPEAPSTSASPTEEPSEAAMGPVETVRAWVDAYNEVVEGGDAEAVYDLSTPGCTTCDNWTEPVLKVHEQGGRIENDGRRVVTARKDPEFHDTRAVFAEVEFTGGRTWPSEGASPESYEPETYILKFELEKEEGTWLVDSLVYLE